jgi:hypothetical protein
MKKKPVNIELAKDDEILREEGMTDGSATILGGIELRPVTATTVSFMNRNSVLSEKDMIWRASAFAFIHSEPLAKVRAVINDPDDFARAVDDWTEAHIKHHSESLKIIEFIEKAFDRYNSAASDLIATTGIASGN